MKHPILRIAGIPHEDFLAELEKLGKALIGVLPKRFTDQYGEPVDLEWAGSSPNECSSLHDDIDLCLVMRGWEEQVALQRLQNENPKIADDISKLTEAFGTKWGVKIDFNSAVPDNKESAIVNKFAIYSVFERKLYGTPDDMQTHYLAFMPYSKRYGWKKYDVISIPASFQEALNAATDGQTAATVLGLIRQYAVKVEVGSRNDTPLKNVKQSWARDEWADDGTTDKWRKIYGGQFQETIIETLPDGKKQLREI
jgi:hypothetical protein